MMNFTKYGIRPQFGICHPKSMAHPNTRADFSGKHASDTGSKLRVHSGNIFH